MWQLLVKHGKVRQRGAQNVMMVTLGTGVGGGIIVDGKIIAGQHGAGGEIGHALVDQRRKRKMQLR